MFLLWDPVMVDDRLRFRLQAAQRPKLHKLRKSVNRKKTAVGKNNADGSGLKMPARAELSALLDMMTSIASTVPTTAPVPSLMM
jgi:hypothetical protein